MRTNEEILNEIHSVKNHKKTTQHIYKHSINKYCELNKLSLAELIEEAEKEEEQELGDYLHKLRNSRNRADYKVKLKKHDVRNSKSNAKLILELLDEFDRNPIRSH